MLIFFNEKFDERIYSKKFAELVGSLTAAALLSFAIGFEQYTQTNSLQKKYPVPTKIPQDFAASQVGLNEEEKISALQFLEDLNLIFLQEITFTINHEVLNKLTKGLNIKVLNSEKKALQTKNLAAKEHKELLELRKRLATLEDEEEQEKKEKSPCPKYKAKR